MRCTDARLRAIPRILASAHRDAQKLNPNSNQMAPGIVSIVTGDMCAGNGW